MHLQDYVANINAQQDYRKKMTANQIWLQGHPPFPPVGPASVSLTPAQAAVLERKFFERRAVAWTHGALPRFQVGDEVRVNLFSLSSEYRKKVKEGDINKLTVHWSPVISRVVQVHPRIGNRRREMYSITVGPVTGMAPPQGKNAPLLRGGIPWMFAGNQLTLAGDIVQFNPRTIPNANTMNASN
jgi:hypothetical protein